MKFICIFVSVLITASSIRINYNEKFQMRKYLEGIKDSRQKKLLINNFESDSYIDEFYYENDFSSVEESFISNKKEYDNFRYLNYLEIVNGLLDLEKRYKNILKIDTAQNLFKLPNPIGVCDGPCYNYIVFLNNKEKFTKDTPHMYISCNMHGDEKIGPSLCFNFIKILVENYTKNKWIKHLLDNRLIIMTPIANAFGYFIGMREEITDEDIDYNHLSESDNNITNFMVDPNRDFPLLKRSNECMLTITARTINEIFTNYLIRFSLSIHSGASSVTFPYGTPNHLKFNKINKDEIDSELLEEFYNSKFDNIINDSTESPDNTAHESN
jgi:hypothetical protein